MMSSVRQVEDPGQLRRDFHLAKIRELFWFKRMQNWNLGTQMSWQRMLFTAVVFTTALMSRDTTTQQCGVNTFSIYQKMLRGHTFKTFKARPGSSDCRQACNGDIRCKSYNYVIFKDICELNNRTKEDRPGDFVDNKDRYYMKASKRGNNN